MPSNRENQGRRGAIAFLLFVTKSSEVCTQFDVKKFIAALAQQPQQARSKHARPAHLTHLPRRADAR